MKVVIIGAGSAFGARFSMDIMSRKPIEDGTIAICDINKEKLERVEAYLKKVVDCNSVPAKIVADTERTELLADADFVIISISVGGPAYFDSPYEFEMEIPRKYGVYQTVGDTVGPGGIFRALRTGPVLMEIAEDVARLAPKATILNYTNPMAMLTWVLNATGGRPAVGLCHGVQGTSRKLANMAGVPYEEFGFWAAGINHLAWFLEATHNGEDVYPKIREAATNPEVRDPESIRFELMDNFGYFPTESTRHDGEYVWWYQHEQERLEWGWERTQGIRDKRHSWYEDMGVKVEQAETLELIRTHEYASAIMEATVTGEPFRFNGNVMNNGLITNLPPGCCVEVPCMVDHLGVHPCVVGDLPPQIAALCRANVSVQELTVRAILDRNPEAAFQALAVDPSTAAVLTLKRTRELFNEMWEAEGDLLSAYPGL